MINEEVKQKIGDISDYVIERGVTNGIYWTRWKSGWLEQSGQTNLIADFGTETVSFVKTFSNTNYVVTFSNWRNGTADDGTWNSAAICNLSSKSVSSFQIYSRGSSNGGRYFSWYACGYGLEN